MKVRLAGLTAWAMLLVLQLVWHAWLVPPKGSLAPVLVLCLVPLLLPILAFRRPERVLFWAALVSLLYFCHGIAEAWSHPHLRLLAVLEVVLSLAVILAAGYRGHPRRRQAKLR